MVAFKKLQKAGLGARGAFGAQQLQTRNPVFHLVQVHQQLVHPEGGPLAHRHQLGRLEMRKAQGGQGLILICKGGQRRQRAHQLVTQKLQPLPHQNDVGIVPHIAAGGAQVQDGHGAGAQSAVSVNMRHDVMAQLLFLLRGDIVVNVVQMGLQLVNLYLADGQAKLHLRSGQGHPKPAPGGKFPIG
ncbi:hypothetical protein SDC9_103690 [bioreactor metagenome]|uniref:Uncharacterized protein n=1 Tax=bioreactor metagenome TaxID=1076179 RepID=A0A645B574_9ZZZZ